MMFRGRQIAHLELGRAVLDRVAATLADVGKIESDAKLEGRNMAIESSVLPVMASGTRTGQFGRTA